MDRVACFRYNSSRVAYYYKLDARAGDRISLAWPAGLAEIQADVCIGGIVIFVRTSLSFSKPQAMVDGLHGLRVGPYDSTGPRGVTFIVCTKHHLYV